MSRLSSTEVFSVRIRFHALLQNALPVFRTYHICNQQVEKYLFMKYSGYQYHARDFGFQNGAETREHHVFHQTGEANA